MSDQITTWIDEDNQVYWQSSMAGGLDVFDVQEALNKEIAKAGVYFDFELTAMDVLEHSKYVYVTEGTIIKEVWPSDEVFEFPIGTDEPLIPVGIIDLEEVSYAS